VAIVGLWFTILGGGLRTPKLHEVATFGDDATLDVPGSPRVILTPGHTPGSAALHVPSRGALFVGDAFATYAVTTGPAARRSRRSPLMRTRLSHRCPASSKPASADLVLPGHGDAWTDGVQEAIRLVRERAAAARD
jgi:glyoxylase-like metal-dependent hydrolase (beta-lactamase superfamily II)